MTLRFSAGSLIVAAILALSATITSAQGMLGGGGGEAEGRIDGRYKVVPIPYLNYDRSLGFSIGALPMVMFNPVASDTLSPSSIAGLLGVWTTNETWFTMGFTRMYFDEDNWRVMAAGGLGAINFQFYLDKPIDSWVPYNTRADFAFTQVERRVVNRLYAGVNYTYMKFDTSFEDFPVGMSTRLNGVGGLLSLDARSSVYYPRGGFLTTAAINSFPEAFDNEFASNKVELDYNHYFAIRGGNDVLAARGFVGLGLGDLSFNQQFIVGQVDIRGYTQGEFRGNYLVAAQGEYRLNLRNRISLVGFMGLATVFDGINASDDGRILPGIGTGFRYTAFEDTHMNVGMDIAAGDGDWGVYFRIGEAF